MIRQFYQGKNNILYACYEEYGLAYYNKWLDRFESMAMMAPELKNHTTSKDVIQDNNNNLWIATKKGLLKFNLQERSILLYTKTNKPQKSLSDNYIRKVTIDKKGMIWIGTIKGLDILDPSTETITHYSEKHKKLGDDILDIMVDNENRKWIGTANNGIVIIDSTDKEFKPYIPNKKDPRSLKVNIIHQKSDDEFWIGTRGGLYIYNETENTTSNCVNNELESSSLVHNSILHIMKDNKGDIWIGTRGGISLYSQEKQAFRHFRSIPNNNKYMNNSEIYSIWIDDEKKVWLGTEKGGVNIYNPKTEKYSYLTSSTINGLNSNCIKKILQLDYSNILIGTFKGGLNIYNQLTKKTTRLQHNPLDSTSISSDLIWDITKDKLNRIWVGTAQGLDLFDYKSLTFSRIKEFNNSKAVSWVSTDQTNDLWLGFDDIIIYRPEEGIVKEIKIKAKDVYEDTKGRFWIDVKR